MRRGAGARGAMTESTLLERAWAGLGRPRRFFSSLCFSVVFSLVDFARVGAGACVCVCCCCCFLVCTVARGRWNVMPRGKGLAPVPLSWLSADDEVEARVSAVDECGVDDATLLGRACRGFW